MITPQANLGITQYLKKKQMANINGITANEYVKPIETLSASI